MTASGVLSFGLKIKISILHLFLSQDNVTENDFLCEHMIVFNSIVVCDFKGILACRQYAPAQNILSHLQAASTNFILPIFDCSHVSSG